MLALQVVQAFKILTSDKQVKAILVNIFGACDPLMTVHHLLVSAISHAYVLGYESWLIMQCHACR